MSEIRLAIAGVGNCASSLVQGLEYYRHASPTERVPGLMHVSLGGYHVGDTKVVAAFDVEGRTLARPRGSTALPARRWLRYRRRFRCSVPQLTRHWG